jgi:hypothetical protein
VEVRLVQVVGLGLVLLPVPAALEQELVLVLQ